MNAMNDIHMCQPPIDDTPFSNNSMEFKGYYGDPDNSGPSFLLERDGTIVRDKVLYGDELSENTSLDTSNISTLDSRRVGIPTNESVDALSLDN